MTLVQRLTKALTLEVEGESFLLRTSKDLEAQRLLDLIWSYIDHVGLPKAASAPVVKPETKKELQPVTTKEVKL